MGLFLCKDTLIKKRIELCDGEKSELSKNANDCRSRTMNFDDSQEPMTRSLPMHFILESTFAHTFLLQQQTYIYINLHGLFLLFWSPLDNFILIGHSKR